MNKVDQNINDLPNILREIANEIPKHKYVLNESAALIEHLAKIRKLAKTIVKENE